MNQISQPASSSEDPSSGAHVEKRSQSETGNVGVQAEKSVLITIEQPRMIPWVCYGLIIFTAVVYFLQFVSQALLGADLPAALGVKSNEAIRTGEIWRLLTPVFLHGSLLHIGFNLYALYAIGPGLERHYGRLRFLMIYFLSAFTGNVLSYIFSPNPSLGASTAMFGLIAAQGIFIYRNRFLFGAKSRPMLANISGIIIINFILGLSPGIDNWGHLGGLIGGLGFAWFAGPRLVVSRNERGYFLLDQTAITVAWLTLLIEALLFSGLAVLV